MNDDYLWNKTGEPDAEVIELEEILGVLRYQPGSLQIPDELVLQRRRNFKPLLSIAATLLLALLATGVWLALHRRQTEYTVADGNNGRSSFKDSQTSPSPERNRNEQQAVNQAEQPKPGVGSHASKRITHRSSQSIALRRQREEAVAAKEQLLLALRVASEKLSQAQRKAQGPTAPNQIRNQHKVG